MATAVDRAVGESLQDLAKRHLWMHFTPHGVFEEREVPIIVRGDGCYVFDEHGTRYLDGLAALFCVNIGHGRADVAQAGADQAKELGFFTNWNYAHPKGDRVGRARSPAWRPATSTACSSRPAARRRSTRRSSCVASTTS
jgi:4-aminobutyrate aminotransferase-like enzyme